MHQLKQLPWSYASKMKTGKAIKNSWWFVGPQGPIFYQMGDYSTPQCNRNRAVLDLLQNQNAEYLNFEIKKVSKVFLGDDYKSYLKRL